MATILIINGDLTIALQRGVLVLYSRGCKVAEHPCDGDPQEAAQAWHTELTR